MNDLAVWPALAHPVRRQILDLIREGPRTSGDIAARFPTTRFAVRKHLNVLEAAGLVLVRPQGRERWNHLNVVPIQTAYERWVTPYQALWGKRLTGLKRAIEKGGPPMTTAARATTVGRVEMEIEIAAPAADVWKALVRDTSFWWPKDFYTGPAKGFHIEPRLGGKVFEDWGKGNGVVWYTVFGINPGVSLDLQGCMAIPYGPALTLLHLELAAAGPRTTLSVSDSTIGAAGNEGAEEKTKGWQQVFGAGLKAYVEAAASASPRSRGRSRRSDGGAPR
jgi:DNA-binding transcriptional ArsR family regulator/uncharacterized protein YndB with AHSA1/START domain